MIKQNAISTFIFEYQGFEFVYGQFYAEIKSFHYLVCKMDVGVVGGQGVVTEIREHV